MPSPEKKSRKQTPTASKTPEFRSTLLDRQSEELIIAISGPVGCGHQVAIQHLSSKLNGLGYKTHTIKLSDKLNIAIEKGMIKDLPDNQSSGKNYFELQTAGNQLRERYGDTILAELATYEIAQLRGAVDLKAKPRRTAYLIDQLKHPAEVNLLRMIYGDLFYLIGIYSRSSERHKYLMSRGNNEEEAYQVMSRDKHENEEFGQKLDSTLHLADYFVRNALGNGDDLTKALDRFLKMLHGATGITPTSDEYGMYSAFAAARKSACLSRQVGAAIIDEVGDLVSTGCNDVPAFGGGLYGASNNSSDNRCYRMHNGMCFNDHHKKILTSEIRAILTESGILDDEIADELERKIRASTRVKHLIEYSRSIHAEMDAIISVSRSGGKPVRGGSLYTTTFPCHNCARHIVAAGISRVLFIEPYEKSLALDLHCDAIEFDSIEQFRKGDQENDRKVPEFDATTKKVEFLYFEGVAPRKYEPFFNPPHEKKDGFGRAVFLDPSVSKTVGAQYLDTYQDYEAKVTEHLEKSGAIDLEKA